MLLKGFFPLSRNRFSMQILNLLHEKSSSNKIFNVLFSKLKLLIANFKLA